jgi:hypothetical protein
MHYSTTMPMIGLQPSTAHLTSCLSAVIPTSSHYELITPPISGHTYTVRLGGSQEHHGKTSHKMYTQASTQPFGTTGFHTSHPKLV